MSPTTTQLLDLDGIGQRASEVRFDVLDQALATVGSVAPDMDRSAATVLHNSNRRINRTLDGVALAPSEQADLDPFGHRLRPVWVLENGAQFNLGVFIPSSADRTRQEWGVDADLPAVDQTLILDQPLEVTVGYSAGQDVRGALLQQFALAQVPSYDVDVGIDTQLANPISWPAGDTTRLQVINDLAAKAGAYSAYFDNEGAGRVRRVPDLSATVPTLVYDTGGRILAGSMVETEDLLAPNRYIVIDSGTPDAAIVGYFDVPDDAPHSFANRGFVVVAPVINEQGLASVTEAEARAEAAYAQDHGTYEWVQFSSPPDPRHDTHDAVLYLGGVYREQGWRLPLLEGSEMTHDLRRVWGGAG